MDESLVRQKNFEKLKKWLDYELPSTALAFFSWFWGILLFLSVIAAIVFIPVMLKILFQEKKYGWLIYFLFLVVIPTILSFVINIPYLHFLPLGLFFFYCFTLKLAVRTWTAESYLPGSKYDKSINTDEVFRNYRF